MIDTMAYKREQIERIKDMYAEIITSAIRDFKSNGPWHEDAKRFLESEDLDFYLEPINMHKDFIRRSLCLI